MILNTNTALNPLYAPSAELGRTPMEALMTIPPGTLLRTGTLLAAGWVGTEAPYTQEVAVTGLPAGAPVVMGLSPSATLAEYDEAAAAGLFITAQGEGTITVSATASLPAGGIPFLLQAENRETEASAILSAFPAKGGSGSGYIPPIAESDFTYTGDYALVDDGDGNWRLKFLTSGTFTPKKDMLIDAFLVGGGGAGYGNISTNASPRPGGAGGYTATHQSIVLYKDADYTVVVGAGGVGASGAAGGNGGTSSFDVHSVNGGSGADSPNNGANGGTGSGASASSVNGNGGDGGSNGGDGTSTGSYLSGIGQGVNTLEFGETGAELYSGAGGASRHASSAVTYKAGNGGAGGSTSLTDGGGIGTVGAGIPSQPYPIGGVSPQYNLSGGAGGGYGAGGGGCGPNVNGAGGDGCQGIAIIRNHRVA